MFDFDCVGYQTIDWTSTENYSKLCIETIPLLMIKKTFDESKILFALKLD